MKGEQVVWEGRRGVSQKGRQGGARVGEGEE